MHTAEKRGPETENELESDEKNARKDVTAHIGDQKNKFRYDFNVTLSLLRTTTFLAGSFRFPHSGSISTSAFLP